MTLPEYLKLIASKIELDLAKGDNEEVARLCEVLAGTLAEKVTEFHNAFQTTGANMKPTTGRIVLYTLLAQDAVEINRRRTSSHAIAERMKQHVPGGVTAWPTGAQAHIGNGVAEGEVYPMIITRILSTPDAGVNGQVLLDGNNCCWVTSVHEGTGPGKWAWPAIEK